MPGWFSIGSSDTVSSGGVLNIRLFLVTLVLAYLIYSYVQRRLTYRVR